MVEEAVVTDLRERLQKNGSAYFLDTKGNRIYLIHTQALQLDFEGVLIAYEGHGAFTFDLDRPLNSFRLISAGFPMQIAEELASLVNRVTRVASGPALIAAPKAKALKRPARRARK